MLQHLKIHNYALIKQLDLDLGRGFCVITGETGAGKSILLGALGLVLGQRADAGVLFDKTQKCIVEAEFCLEDADFSEFFTAHDIDIYEGCGDGEGNEVIIRREVLPAGKSRAFINDTPVTLPVLKQLTERLVDIHSQHQTLELNRSSFQLDLVDSYLGDKSAAEEYKKHYLQYDALRRKLSALKEENERSLKERDYWEFLYGELEQLHLKEGEQAQLEETLETLTHAQGLQEVFAGSVSALNGDGYGIIPKLQETVRNLKKASLHHAGMAAQMPRWEAVAVELQDLENDLNRFSDSVQSDPALQARCEQRLDTIYRLEKKHGVNGDKELLEIEESLGKKLVQAENRGEETERLEKETAEAEKKLSLCAAALHSARKECAVQLQNAILQALSELGMGSSQMEIVFEPAGGYTPRGTDKISFMFSANKGGELREISKTASGGELSRLMLAVKSVIHRGSLLGTLILDEIDTGVSGNIAGKVAVMMKNMSRYMQVIAVTHLPQIAAAAQTHYSVYKGEENGVTVSHMQKLSQKQHVESIAAMLSKDKPTQAAVQAALDLING